MLCIGGNLIKLNTMNKRIYSKIFRMHFWRVLKKGLYVGIIPSYTCNYSCSYCTPAMFGSRPVTPMRTLEEWKKYLIDFNNMLKRSNTQLKGVFLSGGEPTLLPYFVELSDWILDQGWLLSIYTNLSKPYTLIKVKQSSRLIIMSTFHPEQANNNLFNAAWEIVDRYHRTEVDEIGEKRLLSPYKKTRLKSFNTEEDLKNNSTMLRIDSNFAANLYCYDSIKANIK